MLVVELEGARKFNSSENQSFDEKFQAKQYELTATRRELLTVKGDHAKAVKKWTVALDAAKKRVRTTQESLSDLEKQSEEQISSLSLRLDQLSVKFDKEHSIRKEMEALQEGLAHELSDAVEEVRRTHTQTLTQAQTQTRTHRTRT